MTLLFIVLKTISFFLTLGTCLWCWRRIENKRIKVLFCTMLVFFFLSTVLFASENIVDTWLKHILFYAGQFFFYLFIVALIANYDKSTGETHEASFPKNPFTNKGRKTLVAMGVTNMTNSGIKDWVDFITDQGIQHMLALPLLLLIIATIEMRYIFIATNAFRSVMNTFMLAASALMSIHLMEFIVESQKFVPFLDGDINEIVEFAWYYLGLFFFIRGIHKLKNISISKTPDPQVIHSSL